MPAPWTAWKKMLPCKLDSERAEVHDPKMTPRVSKRDTSSNMLHTTRNGSGTCCSKAYSNLRDVIHGNARVVHRADIGSPLPFENGNYLQAISREAASLSPGPDIMNYSSGKNMQLTKLSGCYDCSVASCEPQDVRLSQYHSIARSTSSGYSKAPCQKCGELFSTIEALEYHHIVQHSVTELKDGDSARNVVEIIFQTSWLKDSPCGKIERILKVHNSPKTIAKFEEYRDMVKAKANKLPKKHPRCIADGNELLRFYCTTVLCSLATTASSSLCTSPCCSVCEILKFGFPTKGQFGIYTTASSGKAHDSVLTLPDQASIAASKGKRAMLVCRVIAGRVKKIFREDHAPEDESLSSIGYDSVAGEAAQYTSLEELLVFNPKAVLPCFVVIYNSE